jgi:hypothetical protein
LDVSDLIMVNSKKNRYYQNSHGEIVAKVCSKCDELKPLNEYSKDKNGVGTRKSSCKACSAIYHKNYINVNKQKESERKRIYRENNKEKVSDYYRSWRKSNSDRVTANTQRRRARKYSLPDTFTKDELNSTLNYFGGCALTGDYLDFQWDHVIPLNTGHEGTVKGNMIPLRSDLNQSKSDSNIFEWFALNKERFGLEQDKLNSLVDYLAKQNKMTSEEYQQHVYNCHNNH